MELHYTGTLDDGDIVETRSRNFDFGGGFWRFLIRDRLGI